MTYNTQHEYSAAMRAWIADIEMWQQWAIAETDPAMKAFYRRTLKRCMRQFLAELQDLYVQTSDSRFNYNIWSDSPPPGFPSGVEEDKK